jgi:hypothetical protein
MAVYGLGKPLFIDGRCGFLLVHTLLSLLVNHTVLRWQNAKLYSALFSRKSGSLFAEQVTLYWQINGSSFGTTVPVYLA